MPKFKKITIKNKELPHTELNLSSSNIVSCRQLNLSDLKVLALWQNQAK